MLSSSSIRKPISPFLYEEAFSRNLGLLTSEEQSALRGKRIAIPGCGGVGSLHALLLARAGLGKFSLADLDTFELANFNRQFGARLSTLGRNKAESVKKEILDINPDADVETFSEGIQPQNIRAFLEGTDLVIDGLDFFAFEARELLFSEARALGIPVVTAAPLGFSCALLAFVPGGMSFEDYFDIRSGDSPMAKAAKLAMGLAPRPTHLRYLDAKSVDFEKGRGPSHAVGVALCAAMATATALKILLQRGGVRAAPHYTQFDAFRLTLRRGWLPWGNRNPWQKVKIWAARTFFLKVGNPQ